MLDTKLTETKECKVNLKGNKLFKKANIIFLFIMLVVSIGMIGFSSKIKDDVNKYYMTSYRKNTLTKKVLSDTNPVLFKEALEIKEGKSIEVSDVFIKQSEEIPEEDRKSLKDSIDNFLDKYKDSIDKDYKSLDYDVLDNEGNVIKSNTESELSKLVEENNTKALYNKYLFYITIKYDANGQIDVENVYGAARNKAINDLNQEIIKSDITGSDEDKKYLIDNPIKNVTFVYGVKKSDQDWDATQREMKEDLKEVYGDMSNNSCIFILILIIAVLSLIIPLKFEKEVFLIKKILKMPFEVLLISLTLIISFFLRYSQELIRGSVTGDYRGLLSYLDGTSGSFSIIILNSVYWIAFAWAIFLGVIAVKNIFNIGGAKYFKEKTLISPISKLLKRNVQKVDLSSKSNKLILRIIGINFVMIFTSLFLWILIVRITGIEFLAPYSRVSAVLLVILLGFIYSSMIFIISRKYYNDVSNKFTILLDETNSIAEGNVNGFIIDEDLGVFNPLKGAIIKIKDGFKKAVDEEVKSQRMKTELISNVSHDLKTPLTSIITYVDLLKDEELTDEERKNYLDTLDKKSQRLKHLIEDLFEVSKATSGNIKLNIVKVDIVELMKQTIIELEDKINKANLDIRNSFPKEKVILNLDSQKTFRILENLLINVVKYAMRGSRVYVDILNNENTVEVIIKNMSAEEINFNSQDIVERFERGDKSRNTEGSGLGLAIVKSFVEVQGGNFDVEVDGDLFKVIIIFNK